MKHWIVIFLLVCAPTYAAEPREASPAAKILAQNSIRPGFRLVDGRWVKPEAELKLATLVRVEESSGQHLVRAVSAPDLEPMLRNARVAVVQIEGSTYAWKLSAVGRVWNENRTEATQRLQLVAATDLAVADAMLRLTKIEISPLNSVIQGAVVEGDHGLSVIMVISPDFVELAISKLGEARAIAAFRAPTARAMLRDHPDEARAYMIPMLALVSGNPHVLQPGAGDVYRAFPDLPVDPAMTETINRLIPDLSDRDGRVRDRASAELASLGRPGVQAALRLDLTKLPPEAAERVSAWIQANSPDGRPTEALLKDSAFLEECVASSDPNVRKAAGKASSLFRP